MVTIEQKIATKIEVIDRTDFVSICQKEANEDFTDVVQVEKSSITALIEALKKFEV
jgi:hypothetical protein